MVVCHFFLRGDCKFGDRCRNEHPGAKPTGGFRGNLFGGVSGSSGGFGGTNNEVCQHFLKGNCRYGNNCRFSHVRPSAGQGVFGGQTTFGQNKNTSVFGGGNKNMPFNRNQNRFGALASEGGMRMGASQQNVFGGRQQQSSTEAMLQNATHMTQIQQIVKRDMEAWETSKQWPLSCYTYLKDEPCLTGLLDFSPEEIRKEAYDAKIGNKVSAYEQGLKNLLARSKQRRLELRNINMHQLESEIRASISKHSGESSMSNQTVSQSVGAFGGPTPMSQSQGLFSNNAAATQSGVLFGSSFTTSQQPMGTFGSMAVSSSNMSNTGIFGSTNPAQPASPFGSTAISQKTSPFGSVSTTNSSNTSFGPTSTMTSTFGTSQSAGGASLFGSGSTGQPYSTNVFGNPPSAGQSSNVSGVAPSTSPLTCTEQDIAAFKADRFVLGQIPECPPPPELCR